MKKSFITFGPDPEVEGDSIPTGGRVCPSPRHIKSSYYWLCPRGMAVMNVGKT